MRGFDHFADDAEESVGDASEGTGVLFVALASQRMANRAADGIALDGGHGPVACGVDQTPVRSESSLDRDSLSRALGNGCDSEVASQGFQVGLPDAVEGFGEYDGEDGGSDAWNGLQDVDGVPVFHRRDLVGGLPGPVPDVLDLGVDDFDLPDDPSGGFGDSIDGFRRGRDGLASEEGQ